MFHEHGVHALDVEKEVLRLCVIEALQTCIGFDFTQWDAKDTVESCWSGIRQAPETIPRPNKIRIWLDGNYDSRCGLNALRSLNLSEPFLVLILRILERVFQRPD